MYIQVAGLDVSRDYAFFYEEILRDESVKTKLDVFPGLPHGFWSFFPKAEFTEDWRAMTKTGLRLLVHGK
jgi:acetyl esterase/lipase